MSKQALEYEQFLWGDAICGTRAQLLDLGIGVGQPYPGDAGARKWSCHVQDPRGFDVELNRDGDGRFRAYLRFSGWPKMPSVTGGKPGEFCRGVTKRAFNAFIDEFVGTQDALIAAGLVAPGQFPGCPGRLKTRVIIYASGEVATTRMGAASAQARKPGAKSVERCSKGLYRVHVFVSKEEEERRWRAYRTASAQWEAEVRALPRPPRLLDLSLLSRRRGKCAEFGQPQGNVVSLSVWRAAREELS